MTISCVEKLAETRQFTVLLVVVDHVALETTVGVSSSINFVISVVGLW